jgi:uncharacterized protein YjbI with pentapeptide repeats
MGRMRARYRVSVFQQTQRTKGTDLFSVWTDSNAIDRMTHKKRIAIVDDYGEHIAAIYVEPDAVGFEGADIGGLPAMYIKTLRGAVFRRANLYWSAFCGSDLTGCDFEEADLRGANLRETILVGANLRNAKLGRDNLGGATHLQGADLTGSQLHGCELTGAEYDANTRFPEGFDPELAGMIEVAE